MILILLAAVVSRFIDLGARAVSHDEVNHVVPTFSLYSGNGYQYDPMSHGPLQFHMMALSYALFGDNDFTTRIPAALFSVASIALAMLAFRRYLGRTGAILAGLLFLISPIMLFYGRYARNEAYIVVWGLLTLYATLRYLEHGKPWTLILFTAVNALHFTDKATAYMFAGETVHLPRGLFCRPHGPPGMAAGYPPNQLPAGSCPGDGSGRRGGRSIPYPEAARYICRSNWW